MCLQDLKPVSEESIFISKNELNEKSLQITSDFQQLYAQEVEFVVGPLEG